MKDDAMKVTRLKDYAQPNYFINKTDLKFDLYGEETRVVSRLRISKNPSYDVHDNRLVLDGCDLELITLRIDGNPLDSNAYTVNQECLEIRDVPDHFLLEIEVKINPHLNTALSGLYVSSGNYCTQCEAEGFRRITYYLDRPDVLSEFTTTICADKQKYPVLLSNGNLIDEGTEDNNRHWVKWHDPFKKPSYLFALVGGDLIVIKDQFTTSSGRDVSLEIYVEDQNKTKCSHAISALKKAMTWDEQRFGCEYDLDQYMIFVADDFNMGAMENKGLNIFNSKCVLAKQDTETDQDFLLVDSVIGHEYFHNWSGNRVTCRDWFQLSLKEGLTIFREQEFCADHTSRPVKRIEDVKHLRAAQFSQDASPMAHPVMPDSYIEINNFYTLTIYEKGSEVIRMIQALVGREGFDKGLALYFERHDGQAVTIEDFVKAMEDANDRDFTQFRLWYSQAGTPQLSVMTDYNEADKTYTLTIEQSCPPTPGQEVKENLHIPIKVGLLDKQGNVLSFSSDGSLSSAEQATLELTEAKQEFVLSNVASKPIPSLLREFTAPVKLEYEYSDAELRVLMLHDPDGFNRWDARQQITLKLVNELIEKRRNDSELVINGHFTEDFKSLLTDASDDKLYINELLLLPSESYIAETMEQIDVDAIFEVREAIATHLAHELKAELLACYHANVNDGAYELSSAAIGQRAIKNTCLGYLARLNDPDIQQLILEQFESATNMTDRQAALVFLSHSDSAERKKALNDFYQRYENDALVLDKWFSFQVTSRLSDSLTIAKQLLQHEKFNWNNPNRVRSVLMSFAMRNPVRFHDASGEGYQLLADAIIRLDKSNPQLAARLCDPLIKWRRYTDERKPLMQEQLQRILDSGKLSKDTYEIVSKSV